MVWYELTIIEESFLVHGAATARADEIRQGGRLASVYPSPLGIGYQILSIG